MAAIGESAAQDLIARAAEVGITPEQIAEHLRTGVERLAIMSGNDLSKADKMLDRAAADRAARARRTELLDQVAHLAAILGHDPAAKRAAAEGKFRDTDELARFVRDCAAHARTKGLDPRTPTQKQAVAVAPATGPQIDYVVKLLARRATSGEGGGFVSTAGLYDADGNIDRAAVAALTQSQASTLIDSLTNRY